MSEELETAPASKARRVQILLLLMALCFASHFNRACMATAADTRIMAQFSISPGQMGWVYSAYLLIYTLFMIPGGLVTDRWGARRALFAMGLGSALFGVVTGSLGEFALSGVQLWFGLLLVRGLMGLTTTPLHPGSARAVAEWFPASDRSLANGLVTCAAVLAYAFVHPVFGFLVDRLDWPVAFLISASAVGTIAAFWFTTARNNGPESVVSVHADDSNEVKWWENPSLIFLTLSYAAVGYFQYLFFYWMHYYFDSILHLGTIQSRLYASLPNFALAVAMPLGGWASDRLQKAFGSRARSIVPGVGMVLSGFLLVLGIVAQDVYWIVAWFTCSLGAMGLCEGSFWTTAAEMGGKQGATTASIMNTGGNGIGLLAPLLTPIISASLGWKWGIGLGAFVAVAGGLCWVWISPKNTRRRAPQPLEATA